MNLPDIRKRLSEIDGVLGDLEQAQRKLSAELGDNVAQRRQLRDERASLEATILADITAAMGDAPDAGSFADMGKAVDERLAKREACEPPPAPLIGS